MKRLRPPPEKTSELYRDIWRVVDGAVGNALAEHPEYLADRGRLHDNARRSICKRVVGEMKSFVERLAREGSGA